MNRSVTTAFSIFKRQNVYVFSIFRIVLTPLQSVGLSKKSGIMIRIHFKIISSQLAQYA